MTANNEKKKDGQNGKKEIILNTKNKPKDLESQINKESNCIKKKQDERLGNTERKVSMRKQNLGMLKGEIIMWER